MEAQQKMAITGACLVATGIGLSALGAVLIIPAVVSLAAKGIEKGMTHLTMHAERASRTVGTVAGTLQRSFSEARR